MDSQGHHCDVVIANAFRKAKSMNVLSSNSKYNWYVKDLVRNIQSKEGYSMCFLSNNKSCTNYECAWMSLCNCNDKQTPIES
jgi:hypothetical protein